MLALGLTYVNLAQKQTSLFESEQEEVSIENELEDLANESQYLGFSDDDQSSNDFLVHSELHFNWYNAANAADFLLLPIVTPHVIEKRYVLFHSLKLAC